MTGKVVAFSSTEVKHTSDATCLLFYADHVFSGGADGKIKVSFLDIIYLKFYIYFEIPCRYGTHPLSLSKRSMHMNRTSTLWPLMTFRAVCTQAVVMDRFDTLNLH